jgi:stage III sporulation protein AB
MIIKLIGSIIIIITTTALGMVYAKSKVDRVRQINSFISAFNMLEIEIKFALSLLPDAFIKIAKSYDKKIGEIFGYTANKILEYKINACEAWCEAINKKLPDLCLTNDDKDILMTLGSSLGEIDGESQIKNIRLIVERLKNQMTKAEEDKQKSEKLFKNLGILSGLTLVIILF